MTRAGRPWPGPVPPAASSGSLAAYGALVVVLAALCAARESYGRAQVFGVDGYRVAFGFAVGAGALALTAGVHALVQGRVRLAGIYLLAALGSGALVYNGAAILGTG